MTQRTLNNGETGLVVRGKINDNFTEFFGGTVFPVSPADGDRFFRTDYGMDFYYNAAAVKWLSTQLFPSSVSSVTAGDTVDVANRISTPGLATYDLWLVSWEILIFRSAAGEWDMILQTRDAANAATVLDTRDGSADATTTWVLATRNLGVLISNSTAKNVTVFADEISGTSALTWTVGLTYRLVG